MDLLEREAWVRYCGPDPDTDEMYPLCCAECGTGIYYKEAKWLMKVAFCRECAPKFKEEKPKEPSEALTRLRRHLHGLSAEVRSE